MPAHNACEFKLHIDEIKESGNMLNFEADKHINIAGRGEMGCQDRAKQCKCGYAVFFTKHLNFFLSIEIAGLFIKDL